MLVWLGCQSRINNALSIGLLFFAVVFLICFGLLGLFRGSEFGSDFHVFHDAGRHLLAGIDPWIASLKLYAFSYPPHSTSFIAFYGLMPLTVSKVVHAGVNIVSLMSMVYLANQWFIRAGSLKEMTLIQAGAIALMIANPFTVLSIYLGQMALPCMAAVMWSWRFQQQGKFIVAGVLLGIATLKPQVSMFYVMWLLLSREFRVVFIGGALSLGLMLPGIFMLDFKTLFESWFYSMDVYFTYSYNKPGSPFVVGLESFFAAMGKEGVSTKFLAFICLALAYFYRQRLNSSLIVMLFPALSLTFVYGHDADFVTVIVLMAYVAVLAARRHSYPALILVVFLFLVLFFPQRLLRGVDIPALHHLRTFVIPAMFGLAYWMLQKSVIDNSRERAMN